MRSVYWSCREEKGHDAQSRYLEFQCSQEEEVTSCHMSTIIVESSALHYVINIDEYFLCSRIHRVYISLTGKKLTGRVAMVQCRRDKNSKGHPSSQARCHLAQVTPSSLILCMYYHPCHLWLWTDID